MLSNPGIKTMVNLNVLNEKIKAKIKG